MKKGKKGRMREKEMKMEEIVNEEKISRKINEMEEKEDER